jgi:hypothetical protein
MGGHYCVIRGDNVLQLEITVFDVKIAVIGGYYYVTCEGYCVMGGD